MLDNSGPHTAAAVMGKDYYKILGVSKDVDESELKKGIASLLVLLKSQSSRRSQSFIDSFVDYAAYKKLALKYHPVRPRRVALIKLVWRHRTLCVFVLARDLTVAYRIGSLLTLCCLPIDAIEALCRTECKVLARIRLQKSSRRSTKPLR